MPARSGYYFWVDRWRNERALRFVSWEARALWRFLLDEMSQCKPYGHLVSNGRAPTPQMIAIIVEMPERVVAKALAELEEHGVFSRTDDGVIYCRFMIKDAGRRVAAVEHGKRGGNPALKPNGAGPLRVPDKGGGDDGDNGPDKGEGNDSLTSSSRARVHGIAGDHAAGPRTFPSLASSLRSEASVPLTRVRGTGADAPLPDAKTVLWAEMKAHIGGNKAGSLVGKWLKEYGDGEVFRAHFDAMKENPADYTEWMCGALMTRAGRRAVKKPGSFVQETREFLEEYGSGDDPFEPGTLRVLPVAH